MHEYMGKIPLLAVDAIIYNENGIVLIKRKNPPFEDKWALPGGFLEYGETVEDAVIREVEEETGLNIKIEGLLGVYSKPNRDPRGHIVSIVFVCREIGGKLNASSDARDVKRFEIDSIPELAFDHNEIIGDFINNLKSNSITSKND